MKGNGASSMSELKLAKLPDRTPVKITIVVSPELNRSLAAYAEAYRQSYGETEKVSELIPFILEHFLDTDRQFKGKARTLSRSDRTTSAKA
jgi:hypothetical protein